MTIKIRIEGREDEIRSRPFDVIRAVAKAISPLAKSDLLVAIAGLGSNASDRAVESGGAGPSIKWNAPMPAATNVEPADCRDAYENFVENMPHERLFIDPNVFNVNTDNQPIIHPVELPQAREDITEEELAHASEVHEWLEETAKKRAPVVAPVTALVGPAREE